MLLLVFRYINMKMLNTRLMAKYINSFLILYLLPRKKKESYITFMCILSFFRNITCCCDLEISVHIFIFMCFMIFVFLSFRFCVVFFRHHPHPRSISKLLTEVSVLIIKMCLDFFIASSICFFSFLAALVRLFVGVCDWN